MNRRRPAWRVRLRHFTRAHGPAIAAAAVDYFWLSVVLAGTGALCFLTLGLGV